MTIFLVFYVSVLRVILAINEEYCEIDCQGRSHIGCKNKGDYSPSCHEHAEVLNFNSKSKGDIVDLHNKLRNKIASGGLQPYEPAAKMGSVVWDEELAMLAEMHVKKCEPFKYDHCYNTKNFKYAGQNLHLWTGNNATAPEEAIENTIKGWYEENINADMSAIHNFQKNSNGKTAEHFTVLVNEKNSKIGCAMLRAPKGELIEYYTACNYARDNMKGEHVYESGMPTSGCKSGIHPIYTNLCDISEIYDV